MLMHNNHNQNNELYLKKQAKNPSERLLFFKLLRRTGVNNVEINEPKLIAK